MSLPPSEIPQGAIRFNTDTHKLEFYAQGEWWIMSTDTPNLGRTVDSTPGVRVVFGTGTTPGNGNTFDYINMSSTGNAVDFGGSGTHDNGGVGTVSDRTRGVLGGGQSPVDNIIEFITISSTGDAVDFGDLTSARRFAAGAGNATRGCFGGGLDATDIIDYVTIQSTGNAVDFGNLVTSRGQCAGLASPTRGIFAGGHEHPSPSNSTNSIDFISIATLGDALDFGDLVNSNAEDVAGASNPIKGLIAGGSPAGNASQNVIQSLIIATLGNAVNFGDLVVGATSKGGGASPTRAAFAGGYTDPASTVTNAIDYVEFATEGNAVDFGDLSQARDQLNGASNGHGGL